MTGLFDNLLLDLNKVDWGSTALIQRSLEGILSRIRFNQAELISNLSSLLTSKTDEIFDLSVETSTHYKWHLYQDLNRRYRIWLHEYKGRESKKYGYAETPHNHRYCFASLILKGGFLHNKYIIERQNSELLRKIEVESSFFNSEGKIYTFNPQLVHSLSDIQDSTLTLIIQSRAINKYSESFCRDSLKITRHYPFESKLNELDILLRSIDTWHI